MARLLILGGGFGGLAAAHELRQAGDHEITLVARDDRFAMGFAKLWDLAGLRPIADGTRSLHDLSGIRFVHGEVHTIDPEHLTVETSEEELQADALLIALGAADHPEQVAMLGGDAHNLYDARALPAMRSALARLSGGRLVLAVLGQPFKCPPAPFEAALLIDEVLRADGRREGADLVIATPAPSALPVAGPEASSYVAGVLADRGIELRTEQLVTEIDRDGHRVRFDSGDELGFEVLFGVPGAAPPKVLARSPLPSEGGWIVPDPTTLRTPFARVYAVGDCTTVPTATAALPKAGVFAAGEGIVAARNMLADLGEGEPAAFDGHGFCYLEFPDRQVALVEGDFFAQPKPDVAMTPPSREAFEHKQRFERDRLDAWFG